MEKKQSSEGTGVTSDRDSLLQVQRMPKVELHLHLDCSLSYEVVSRLDPSITHEDFQKDFIAPRKCRDLMHALTRAHRAVSLLQTREALRLATEDIFQQLVSDNVIYAELRFAPLLHLEQGLTAHEVVATIDRVTEDCIRTSGIEARVILCTLRHFSREQSVQTVQLIQDFKGSRVVALDIAGDEAGYPLEAHVEAFRFAIEQGIHRTAHAGEAAGPASVWETLRQLQPTRIGHGVRSHEDPELVAQLRSAGIHLEVCPSSNVQTNTFETYTDHSVGSLFHQGVSLNINTDCRTIFDITLNREYDLLHAHFDWRFPELWECNHAAIRAAFIEDSEKRELIRKLELHEATFLVPRL